MPEKVVEIAMEKKLSEMGIEKKRLTMIAIQRLKRILMIKFLKSLYKICLEVIMIYRKEVKDGN